MIKDTVQSILNRNPSLDNAEIGLGDRLAQVDKQIGWHGVTDSANRLSKRSITDLASCIVFLNEMKVAYTAHIALGEPTHDAADATNTIGSADATDQASAETLANELKEELNDHCALAASHDRGGISVIGEAGDALSLLDLINYTLDADATTLATLITLCNKLQTTYYNHTFIGPARHEEIVYV